MSELICDLWLCQCCTLLHANGECCDSEEHGGDSAQPLSRIGERESVTLGLLAEEHADGCTQADRQEGCDCERREFDTSQCDGCGSYLAGERHAAALWREAESETVQ